MRQVKLPFWVLVKKRLAECEESSENTLSCDIFAYFQFGLEDQWTSYYLRHIQTDSGAAVNHHRVVRWCAGLLDGGVYLFFDAGALSLTLTVHVAQPPFFRSNYQMQIRLLHVSILLLKL